MDYLSGWCKSERRLDSLTAIVTGCNTGIGKETVRDFYIRGARVIMACRDLKKAEEAKKDVELTESEQKKGTIVVEKLDLSSLKSVREFSFKILEQKTRIDILVNNAGVMCCPEGKTEDGFETHIDCKLDFEDLNFEKTRYDPIKAYCRSKAANVLYAKALARKLKDRGVADVTTYSLHPGVINTEIGRHFSATVWYGATWAFYNIVCWFAKSPRCGAQTSIYCAIDESCAKQSGWYYSDCAPVYPSKHCRDNAVADTLWDVTLEKLKLNNYDPFGKEDPQRSLFDD